MATETSSVGSVGKDILVTLLKSLNDFTKEYYILFVKEFEMLFLALLTLYIIGIGYAVLMNMLGEKTKSAGISLFFVMFSYLAVFSPGFYLDWMVIPLREASLNLTAFVLNPSASPNIFNIYDKVDQSFSTIFDITAKYSNEAGFTWGVATLQRWLVNIGLVLLFGVLYAVFTGLLLVGLFSLHVMLVLGGIMILLAGFPFSRHIFWAWLRSCFNYALIPVFTGIVMAITLQVLDQAAINMKELKASQGIFNKEIGSVFLIGILSVWFHLKAPEFTALLTGSTSTGSGFFSTLGAMAGAGTGAAAAGSRGAAAAASSKWGKAAGDYGVRAYSRMKGLVK